MFVAIEIGSSARERIAGMLPTLRALAPSAKWVPPENLHITLVFLGSTSEERVAGICGALDAAAAVHPPLSLGLAAGGAFGHRKRPKVLWVGLSGQLPRLEALFTDLEQRLEVFGYRRDPRNFRPHLTLARSREPRGDPALAACLPNLSALQPMPLDVPELVLFKSSPGPHASIYEVIHRAPFRGAGD
ncbi:MAG: RNA 2',3'-cyclic phosphodiesterase [Myxococcaceae bacterium]|nr:RNA 2',3'-cyclic phosphodiesterase [Myxococcaceae bacterium]